MTWGPDELIVELRPGRVEIRVRVDREGPVFRDFSLQLIAIANSNYFPVVRNDTSHGEAPHRDILNWDGSTQRKGVMWEGLSYLQAFDYAYDDLVTNWERYVEDFLRRRP